MSTPTNIKPLMYCPRCVFNQGQHRQDCTKLIANRGGLFNPHQNIHEQFWGPGGVRDRMREQLGLPPAPHGTRSIQ